MLDTTIQFNETVAKHHDQAREMRAEVLRQMFANAGQAIAQLPRRINALFHGVAHG